MSAFGDSVDFVKIKDFYFIDKNRCCVKIPLTATEIYQCNYLKNTFEENENKPNVTKNDTKGNLKDVYWYSKAIREKNKNVFIENCSNKNSLLFKAFENDLINFESTVLFPQYGLSAVVEYLSLDLAMKGRVFCLNPNLKKYENKQNETIYEVENAQLTGNKIVKSSIENNLSEKNIYKNSFG